MWQRQSCKWSIMYPNPSSFPFFLMTLLLPSLFFMTTSSLGVGEGYLRAEGGVSHHTDVWLRTALCWGGSSGFESFICLSPCRSFHGPSRAPWCEQLHFLDVWHSSAITSAPAHRVVHSLLGLTHYSLLGRITLVLTHMAQILSSVNILVCLDQTHNSKAAATFLCFDIKQVSSSWLSLTLRLSQWNSDQNPIVWEHIENWVVLLKSVSQFEVKGSTNLSSS